MELSADAGGLRLRERLQPDYGVDGLAAGLGLLARPLPSRRCAGQSPLAVATAPGRCAAGLSPLQFNPFQSFWAIREACWWDSPAGCYGCWSEVGYPAGHDRATLALAVILDVCLSILRRFHRRKLSPLIADTSIIGCSTVVYRRGASRCFCTRSADSRLYLRCCRALCIANCPL